MTLFNKFFQYKKKKIEDRWFQFQRDKIIYLDKKDVIDEGIFKFKHLQKSGFCTFFTGLSFWNINSDYFNESRKASQRLKNFIRVFVIKNIRDLENNYLLVQMEKDIDAQVKVYICFFDDIPSHEAKKDFGIWDDEYLCVVDYSSDNEVTGIMISGRQEDIQKSKMWQRALLDVSKPVYKISDIEKYKEDNKSSEQNQLNDRYKEFQLQSIELQMSIAQKECITSYVDPLSCQWYHSSWPILRALNVVSTPNWHGNFYIKAVSDFSKNKDKVNILIPATADATILEHIEAGLGTLERARIWVTDLCPTPLEICRRYAQLRHQRIYSAQLNSLDLFAEGLRDNYFDIIITDAFISRFKSFDEKMRLILQWHKVLKPHGIVITTCRVTGEKEELGQDNEINRFVQRTTDVFNEYKQRTPEILKYATEELVRLKAHEYASHIISYPIKKNDLLKLFYEKLFLVLDSIENELPGEFKPTIYMQIVAQKT